MLHFNSVIRSRTIRCILSTQRTSSSLIDFRLFSTSLRHFHSNKIFSANAEMVRVLVPIADGSEDLETSAITDILARGGVDVVTASVMPKREVKFARGLHAVANCLIGDVHSMKDFDAVILPGGMPGAKHLAESAALNVLISEAKSAGKMFGAICASPAVALAANGHLEGIGHITCYPGMSDKLPHGTTYVNNKQS